MKLTFSIIISSFGHLVSHINRILNLRLKKFLRNPLLSIFSIQAQRTQFGLDMI